MSCTIYSVNVVKDDCEDVESLALVTLVLFWIFFGCQCLFFLYWSWKKADFLNDRSEVTPLQWKIWKILTFVVSIALIIIASIVVNTVGDVSYNSFILGFPIVLLLACFFKLGSDGDINYIANRLLETRGLSSGGYRAARFDIA